jgi:hypothetical protein
MTAPSTTDTVLFLELRIVIPLTSSVVNGREQDDFVTHAPSPKLTWQSAEPPAQGVPATFQVAPDTATTEPEPKGPIRNTDGFCDHGRARVQRGDAPKLYAAVGAPWTQADAARLPAAVARSKALATTPTV